jgi:hypothetical protein
MKTPLLLSILLLAPAAAADEEPDGWSTPYRLELSGGWFDGERVIQGSGGFASVGGRVVPTLRSGEWTVEIPVDAFWRQTFPTDFDPGTGLDEGLGTVHVKVENQVSRAVRLSAAVGLLGAYRPDWPDLYQPLPDGTLTPTNRYSYVSWDGILAMRARLAPHQYLRFEYRFVQRWYDADPEFQPDVDPMHLTPRDNAQSQVYASWRYLGGAWTLQLKVDFAHRNDYTLLAREAVTGSTNGGTTPLQRLNWWEPAVELDLEKLLGGWLDLSLEYGFQIQTDLYQGYYSYTAHNPVMILDAHLGKRFDARLRLGAEILEYGPDSTDPANLDDGERRWDDRYTAALRLRYDLGRGLRLFGDVAWVDRATNYPDYVMGVNSSYNVQWDYRNLWATGGIVYER